MRGVRCACMGTAADGGHTCQSVVEAVAAPAARPSEGSHMAGAHSCRVFLVLRDRTDGAECLLAVQVRVRTSEAASRCVPSYTRVVRWCATGGGGRVRTCVRPPHPALRAMHPLEMNEGFSRHTTFGIQATPKKSPNKRCASGPRQELGSEKGVDLAVSSPTAGHRCTQRTFRVALKMAHRKRQRTHAISWTHPDTASEHACQAQGPQAPQRAPARPGLEGARRRSEAPAGLRR